MTEETKAIIKATAPVLKEHGEAITQEMYKIMFNNHPEVQALFKDAEPDQHKKLGGKSERTKNIRSATPRGFSQAVYEVNK